MNVVEKELIEATGYKPARKFANRQDYLGSILNAVLKLSNDDFDALTDDAAAWANAAVEAKNSKADELPDFDEVTPEEGDEGDEDESADDTASELEPEKDVEAVAEEKSDAKSRSKPAKAPKGSTAKRKPVPDPEPEAEMADVVMDKWGAMEGSKNSVALGMFEKGATSKEVKDALGGTYYNILKRMVMKGHKVEKEGSLIKLTHTDDTKPKVAKKKK